MSDLTADQMDSPEDDRPELPNRLPANVTKVSIETIFGGRVQVTLTYSNGAAERLPGDFTSVSVRADGAIKYGTD